MAGGISRCRLRHHTLLCLVSFCPWHGTNPMTSRLVHYLGWVACSVVGGSASSTTVAAEGAGFDDEIVVVAPAPGAVARLPADRLPFTV